MADDATIVAEIVLDFKTQNEAAVAQARGALEGLGVQSKATAAATQQVSSSFGQLETAAKRTANDALGQYALALKTGVGDTEALRASAAHAVQEYDSFGAAAKKAASDAESSFSRQAKAAEAASAAHTKYQADLKELGKAVSTAGIAIGVAAVALDVFAGRAASNFQRAMEMIHTQAGASQAEVESLTKSVLAMAGSVGTGPQQLADGLYHIESAGLRGAEALKVLHAAAIGAKVGNADLEAVTQSLISATVSHIGGVKNEIDAMAQLNAIVGTGDVRMQDLASALSTGILPAATVVGLHLRDVGAAMATLTDNAVPAEEAATRLRMTFSLMAAPAQVGAKALASIGLSATQLGEDMRKPNGLLRAVEDLKAHLEDSGKTAVQQEQIIARAFGGGRSSSAIETLLTQVDRLKSKYEEQAKLVGQFGEAWDRTQKTAAFATSQFEANAQTLEITLGAALLPSIVAIEKAMTPVAQAIQHIAAVSPGAVTAVSAIALGFGGLSLALKGAMALAAPWNALLNVVGKEEANAGAEGTVAATGIARTGEAAAAATGPVGAYAASLALADEGMAATGAGATAGARRMSVMAAGSEEAAASTGILSGALDTLLGPAGLVLLGATLGTIAYEKSPAFREEVNKAADALQTKLKAAIDITGSGLDLLGNAMDAVNAKLDQGGKKAGEQSDKWQKLGDVMHVAFHGVIDPLSALGHQLDVTAAAHDRAAAAARRQADALEHLGLTEKQVQGRYSDTGGAAFGGTNALDAPKAGPPASIGDQVKYFNSQSQATFDAATKQAAADLKAYALAVESGATAQKQLFAQAVGSTQYAKELGDKLQAGSAKVELAAGDFSAALQSTSQGLKDASGQALAALVFALHNHTGNIQQLTQAAAQAAKRESNFANEQQQAAMLVAKASGEWAAVLQGEMSTAQKAQANAMAQLTLGILSGSKNLGPLAQAAANATRGSDKFTAAQQAAISMVEKLTGVHLNAAGKISTSTQKLTTALDDLTKALQDKVNQALSDVTLALLHHKGNLDALVSAGAQATTKLQNATNKEDEARLLIAKKAGDWAAVIDLERQHLQKVLTEATAQYAQDRSTPGTPASVLSADKGKVDAANHALDSFNKNVTDAGQKLLTTAQRFADEQSKAQKRYDDALGTVAADFLKTGTTTKLHEAALVSSKKAVDGFTTAMDRATASALSGGALFAADQTDAQKRYDDALNTVAGDLKTSGTVTQAHWQALVKANTGLGGFSTALQQAQDRLKPPGPAADLRTDQDAAQKTYDDAVATVTRDIIAHGQATRKDLQALSDAKNGLDLFTGVAKKVAALFTTPAQRFRDQESAAQQKAANMADRLADSLMHGGSGAGIWADAAISAARVVQQYADAHAKAQAIIQAALAKTGDGFITASQRLSLLNQTIQDLIDAAVTNQTRTKPMPGAETGASQGGTGEQSSSISKDLDAAIRERIELERRLSAETRKVAASEGDFTTVFSIDQQALSKSLDDLTGAFITGTGDVAALTAAYLHNKQVVEDETAERIKVLDSVGEHSQALQLTTQQMQTGYDNAIAGITEKLLRHQQVTQADIDAAAGYAQSLKALAQTQWDTNFAVADAAEKAKLLSDRFSSIVSQASTITSAQGSVVSANLTVFNDQATEQTRLLQSLVTEVTDQTSIISAQSGVVKAGYDGQIAAVKDQSGIEQALADIQKATTAAELAVAQQELVVARDTYQVDQESARQNGIIARDQVRIASVKATADRADAQAAAAVARAHLKVDQDNVTLTEDQLQLQALMLPPLELIASAFGNVQAYQQQVVRAVTTINADQRAIWADTQNLAVATANQQQTSAAGQLAAAQAAQQLALDQASAEASSSAGQLKIQQDTARLQSLQYQAQMQGNAIALSSSSSNNALLQEQNNMFRRFFQVLASGALGGSRNYRAGGSAFLNQFTVEAHGAPSP